MASAGDAIGSQANQILGTYICTEPFRRPLGEKEQGSMDLESLLENLQTSLDYFSKQGRSRTVERVWLEIARAKTLHGKWREALQIILKQWRNISWRRSGWFVLLEELDWMLRECARHVGDIETLVAVEWELLCRQIRTKPNHIYDFAKCLVDIETSRAISVGDAAQSGSKTGTKPRIVTSSDQSLSCVSAKFAFTLGKGHVGEALPFQVIITSLAQRASVPIELSHLRLAFEGSFRNVNLQHDSQLSCQTSATDEFVQFCTPTLKKADFHDLQGACDLKIFPSTSKVIFLSALPLEAGKIELSKISIGVEVEHFDFEFVFGDYLHQDHAWSLEEKRLSRCKKQSTRSVSVDPKPPRIRIEVLNLLKAYFTGEQVFLDVQISNDEDEESNVDIEITLDDQAGPSPILRWGSKEEGVKPAMDGKYNGAIKTSLGSMASSEIRRLTFSVQAVSEAPQHTLEITAKYFLISDPHTPVLTAVSMDMLILRPFEANFNFVPQIKEDTWPSFFVVDTEAKASKAKGLDQRWAVHAAIASFASTDLILEAVDLQIVADPENAVCNILPNADLRSTAATLFPQGILERTFIMDLQNISLDDCCTTCFDLQLRILWRRDTADTATALTYLHLPEFIVPFSEPRVLASANRERDKLELRYLIENPSMHVLSFSVTMEASEDFAFSGPKATSVQLVPYSRQSIQYTLLPFYSRWINPQARIADVIWNKMLKVQATGDLKGNKDGISIWIDDQR